MIRKRRIWIYYYSVMSAVVVYLNEQSANGQYNGHPWQKGLTEMFNCLDLFRTQKSQSSRYYSADLYTRPFLYDGTVLSSVLKKNPDYNRKFRHYLKDFSLSGQAADASLSAGPISIRLNFQYGPCPDDSTKGSFSSVELLLPYLKAKGLIASSYDSTSSIPPRDDETFLADKNVFQMTQHAFQGRKMYRKIGTSELWYVDNLHYGMDAHIEVFNETTKKQIAVSRVDKEDFFRPLTDEEKARTLIFDRGK